MKQIIHLTLSLAMLITFLPATINIAQAANSERSTRHHQKSPSPIPVPTPTPSPIPAPTPSQKSFSDNFNTDLTLQETGSMSESTNPNWWINSGAYLIDKNGVGQTIQGDLSSSDPWFKEYKNSNPVDTDNGLHPQNIFRLVTKTKWQNLSQQSSFKITKTNLSSSPERYDPNGLLLFNRYVDENNLYYTGIRVDGTAVIKKKINGTYYTMAQTKIFPGTYNKTSNPNLLPLNSWLTIKSQVVNNTDGTVNIKLYLDKDNSGNFQQIFNITDDGIKYGKAISTSGYAGIRTDFMDVQFDNYNISEF